MKTIKAYKCADGSIHIDEKKAKEYDDDLIGQELDELLFKIMNLDITRSTSYKAILQALEKRKELYKFATTIIDVLEHNDQKETDDE